MKQKASKDSKDCQLLGSFCGAFCREDIEMSVITSE